MIGTIKSYSSEKENGYIKTEDGKEYFFDISYLKNKDEKNLIKENLSVVFSLSEITPTYSQIKDFEIQKEEKIIITEEEKNEDAKYWNMLMKKNMRKKFNDFFDDFNTIDSYECDNYSIDNEHNINIDGTPMCSSIDINGNPYGITE